MRKLDDYSPASQRIPDGDDDKKFYDWLNKSIYSIEKKANKRLSKKPSWYRYVFWALFLDAILIIAVIVLFLYFLDDLGLPLSAALGTALTICVPTPWKFVHTKFEQWEESR